MVQLHAFLTTVLVFSLHIQQSPCDRNHKCKLTELSLLLLFPLFFTCTFKYSISVGSKNIL